VNVGLVIIVFRKGRVVVELSISMDLNYLQDEAIKDRPWIQGLPGETLSAIEEMTFLKVLEVAQKAEFKVPYPN